jgi:hypothetical protein
MKRFKDWLNEEQYDTNNLKTVLKNIIDYLSKHKNKFKDGNEFLNKAKKLIKQNKFSKADFKLISNLDSNVKYMQEN